MASKQEALLWLRRLNAQEEKMTDLWGGRFSKEVNAMELPGDVKEDLIELINTMVSDCHKHEDEFNLMKKHVEESDKDDY